MRIYFSYSLDVIAKLRYFCYTLRSFVMAILKMDGCAVGTADLDLGTSITSSSIGPVAVGKESSSKRNRILSLRHPTNEPLSLMLRYISFLVFPQWL